MRALITGGTGFVGLHLIQALLDAGADRIVVLCRRMPQRSGVLNDPRVIIHDGVDICNSSMDVELFRKIDTVFHLAASMEFSNRQFMKACHVNAHGTGQVLSACVRTGVRTLVAVSSIAALGYRHDGDLTEDFVFPWETRRSNAYMRSKHLAEEHLLSADTGALRITIANPTLIIGPGRSANTQSLMRYLSRSSLVLTPPGALNVIDVRDVARALLVLAESGRHREQYIVGNENVDFGTLYRKILQALGRSPRMLGLPRAARHLLYAATRMAETLGVLPTGLTPEHLDLGFLRRPVSTAKLRALGWKPHFSLTQSVEDMVALTRRQNDEENAGSMKRENSRQRG